MIGAASSNFRAARARSLADLTAGLVDSPPDVMISDVTLDSRAVSSGALFLACQGRTHHGIEFANQAAERGARAVLFETGQDVGPAPRLGSHVFVAGVPHLGRQVGLIADRFFAAPSERLTVAGITGTNGKTTSAFLLAQALEHVGRRAVYVGTLGHGFPGALSSSDYTTSDAVTVHRQLAASEDKGADCVAMEVSSHALDQHRVNGVRFHTAAFTNLTRDHLDYHGDMEAYGAAKARLFSLPTLACRVINVSDEFGARLATQSAPGRLVVTSVDARSLTEAVRIAPAAEFVCATRVSATPSGLEIDIESSWGAAHLSVPLIGAFNAENVLTVSAVLLAWGIPLDEVVRALDKSRAPAGRMEAFGGTASKPLVIVDFAHTPDALAKALRAVRAHCSGKLRVVFGCGGDRDAGKRPLMGRVAAELADEIVLTDDNPRNEEPRRIVAAIRAGIGEGIPVLIEHDRARAIRLALQGLSPGDAVLIAGKGHEAHQIYGAERRQFSDQLVVRAQLGETQP